MVNLLNKIVEISTTEDDDINDFIEEQGSDSILIRVTCQEDENLWGDIVKTGESFPYHFEIKDICNVVEGEV